MYIIYIYIFIYSRAHNICVYLNTGALLYRDTVNDKRERLYENLFGESENSVRR